MSEIGVAWEDDLPALPQKLKILHVHTLPVVSGSGIAVYLTMKGLRARDVEISLACAPGGPLQDLVAQAGLRFIPIETFVSEVSVIRDLKSLWALYQLLRKETFHIVHTHNSKAGFVGRLAARTARVPIIVHTVRGFAFHDKTGWLARRLYVFLERRAARWCDILIFISQPLMDWAARLRISAPRPGIKIYSGIDLEGFRKPVDRAAARRSLGVGDDDLVVGIVAKLWEGKGHRLLINAFANLARAHRRIPLRLLVIGSGPLEQSLRRQVESLGLQSQILFAGFRSDVPAITAALDISVLPSDFEGMGRVVLEAMAMGKPVIGSRVGGIPDLVDDEITGLLVPAGDQKKFEAALERLALDPALRARMGAAGAQKMGAQYSADTMVRRTIACYRSLLKKKLPALAAHRIGSFDVCLLESSEESAVGSDQSAVGIGQSAVGSDQSAVETEPRTT